jgi:nitroimidazol reductase NimA-like FMN-containing flavoprotein (pyridoxamine 5'-phosphate oxidase superfamily)
LLAPSASDSQTPKIAKRFETRTARKDNAVPAPMTRQEREQFLAAVHVGILSVNQPGRAPLVTPLWYVYEPGGEIVVVTRPETRKARLIAAGTPVSFLVQTEDLPPKYVSVEGRVVSVAPANVDRDLRPITQKYLGADVANGYLDATRPNGATNEVVIRIRPERWFSRDFGKPG